MWHHECKDKVQQLFERKALFWPIRFLNVMEAIAEYSDVLLGLLYKEKQT